MVYREEWMRSQACHGSAERCLPAEALNECFKTNLFDYSLVENTIVLKEKPRVIPPSPPLLLIDISAGS